MSVRKKIPRDRSVFVGLTIHVDAEKPLVYEGTYIVRNFTNYRTVMAVVRRAVKSHLQALCQEWMIGRARDRNPQL